MEKKGNRYGPSSSRGTSGSDLKKNQDPATSKTRNVPRRREPSCGFSKSNDSFRKPQSQRNSEASDKRPRARGYYYSGALSRNEETGLDVCEESEVGSVFQPGSKKQSLNHLLNFTFAPRVNSMHERSPQGKVLPTKLRTYNKEHFLQANCQFVVNEKGTYNQYLDDPDSLVDWNFIEQVNLQVNEYPSCPVCLYPPVSAKMTKCGHIYCWSCILHYLALSDREWRKCPICYDAINKNDLKSVTILCRKTFNVSDTITFKLMKRQKGSLIAYPADAQVYNKKLFEMEDTNNENCYSKLLMATKDDILKIIAREETQLEVQMAQEENCPEKCFIEEAMGLLKTRKALVLEYIDSQDRERPIEKATLDSEQKDNSILELSSITKFYYFYQSCDGQHIYLHSINARMLEHTYGSLENGPKLLTGQILEKEGGSMTEEIRNRYRYLQHLPVTCQFEIAEIRLEEPAISKTTLDYFKKQVDIRTKNRKLRAKEEEKRERRIEVEENRKIGKYQTPELHLENTFQFPGVQESHHLFPEYISASRLPRTDSESSTGSGKGEKTNATMSPGILNTSCAASLESNYAGPSFASMAASDKKNSKLHFQLDATKDNFKFPEAQNYSIAPDFSNTFGEALAQALSNVKLEDKNGEDLNVSCSKKKKKSKPKVLFTTNLSLAGN